MTNTLRRIAAALAFTLAIASLASAQSRETEQVDRTVPLQPGGTLKLKNFSGDIRITGADAAEVSIHAIRRATRERLDRIKNSLQRGIEPPAEISRRHPEQGPHTGSDEQGTHTDAH